MPLAAYVRMNHWLNKHRLQTATFVVPHGDRGQASIDQSILVYGQSSPSLDGDRARLDYGLLLRDLRLLRTSRVRRGESVFRLRRWKLDRTEQTVCTSYRFFSDFAEYQPTTVEKL